MRLHAALSVLLAVCGLRHTAQGRIQLLALRRSPRLARSMRVGRCMRQYAECSLKLPLGGIARRARSMRLAVCSLQRPACALLYARSMQH